MTVVFYDRALPKMDQPAVYIRRSFPNDRETVTDRLATEADKREHPMEWAAYQQARVQPPVKKKAARKKRKGSK